MRTTALIAAVGVTLLCAAACSSTASGHGAAAGSVSLAPTTASSTAASTLAAAPVVAATTSTPAPVPVPINECAGNVHAQLVLVSISTQTAWMCSGETTVYTSPVTTGATADGYDDTPTGTFRIERRQTDETLTLISGAKYHVNYWLPFSGNLYGFHDAAWQTMPFGSQDYHTLGSHGCVHLPMASMAWLYDWASVGATVTVRA